MYLIYIAGPFRGPTAWDIEKNIRRAEEASFEVWQAGAVAVCPHANTRYFHGSLPDKVFIDGTLSLLSRCHGVLMLPDWKKSLGARGELAYAVKNHIPIFYTVDEVADWISERKPTSTAAPG